MLKRIVKPRKTKNFGSFADMWWWLKGHPMVEHATKPRSRYYRANLFHEAIYIGFHLVNPTNNTIDDDDSRNTKLQCWLEFGPAFYNRPARRWECSHDPKLDCGGDTFEEAVINLVSRVLKHYGDYVEIEPPKGYITRLERKLGLSGASSKGASSTKGTAQATRR